MSVDRTIGQCQTLFETELLVRYFAPSRTLNHHTVEIAGQVPVFSGGKLSRLSLAYIMKPSAICRLLLMQVIVLALVLAIPSAGSNNAARIAMMAMTTRSSIKVNAAPRARSVSILFTSVARPRA